MHYLDFANATLALGNWLAKNNWIKAFDYNELASTLHDMVVDNIEDALVALLYVYDNADVVISELGFTIVVYTVLLHCPVVDFH